MYGYQNLRHKSKKKTLPPPPPRQGRGSTKRPPPPTTTYSSPQQKTLPPLTFYGNRTRALAWGVVTSLLRTTLSHGGSPHTPPNRALAWRVLTFQLESYFGVEHPRIWINIEVSGEEFRQLSHEAFLHFRTKCPHIERLHTLALPSRVGGSRIALTPQIELMPRASWNIQA